MKAVLYLRKNAGNRYQAAVKFRGEWVYGAEVKVSDNGESGAKVFAVEVLGEELIRLGCKELPTWHIIGVEGQEEEPETVRTITAKVPELPIQDRGGSISPMSDLDSWVKTFIRAYEEVERLSNAERSRTIGERPVESEVKWFRDTVNALMEDAGAIGAWRYTPSQESYLNLARRMGAKVVDPTIQQPGRNAWRERRALAGGSDGSRKRKNEYGHGSEEQRKTAISYGRACANKAREGGVEDRKVLALYYKYGYCKQLREFGLPPHVRYESDLVAVKFPMDPGAAVKVAA